MSREQRARHQATLVVEVIVAKVVNEPRPTRGHAGSEDRERREGEGRFREATQPRRLCVKSASVVQAKAHPPRAGALTTPVGHKLPIAPIWKALPNQGTARRLIELGGGTSSPRCSSACHCRHCRRPWWWPSSPCSPPARHAATTNRARAPRPCCQTTWTLQTSRRFVLWHL